MIGAAGRSCTCMDSFRRRMPRLFRPRQRKNWIGGLVDWWIGGLMAPQIRDWHQSTHPIIQQPTRRMVSAAGLAPAIPRFQAEHVAATPHAGCPDAWEASEHEMTGH